MKSVKKITSPGLQMVIMMMFMCITHLGYAQSFLNKLKKKAEQTAQDKILDKTGDAVSAGVDKAVDKTVESVSKTDQTNKKNKETATPVAGEPGSSTKSEKERLTFYSKYDFVPGELVFYANDFADENIGELPIGWNSNGNSVLVTLDGIPGNWLRMSQQTVCLSENKTPFDNDFTVEFDLIMQFDFKGWLPPSFTFGLLSTGAEAADANRFLTDTKGGEKTVYMVISALEDGANVQVESYQKSSRYFYSQTAKSPLFGQWFRQVIHVAMQGQKERLRIWMNGEKMYDIPKAISPAGVFNQLYFQLSSSPYQDEQVGIFIGNLKMAKGMPDTRHKLVEEGKFSTTGILFDAGKAIIKPESAGTMREIAGVLTKNADIRLNIVGHTDADGEEQINQQLSEQRAQAVKDQLIKDYNISAERLSVTGKGESAPVADNNIKEGKAQNRRVEFVKL